MTTGASRYEEFRPLQLLHGNAGPRALRLFRGYVFGLWFLHVALDPLTRLAYLPTEAFQPTGILHVLPASATAWLLTTAGLATLKWTLVVLSGLAVWPRAFRLAAPPAAVLLIAYQSLIRSFIHINHAEILLLLTAVALALFALLPRSRDEDVDGAVARGSVQLVTVAAMLALSYFLLGTFRLYSEVYTITGDTILDYVASRSFRVSYYDFNLGIPATGVPAIATALRLGFPLVTGLEVLAPLVLVSPWFRRFFLAVMAPFHILTLVLMEVSFIENLLLYPIFIDFSGLVNERKTS